MTNMIESFKSMPLWLQIIICILSLLILKIIHLSLNAV